MSTYLMSSHVTSGMFIQLVKILNPFRVIQAPWSTKGFVSQRWPS